MIAFRHADPRFPFLWEGPGQPPARWHDATDPATHYFADTPNGAWAEFLRHEEITEPGDLDTIRRAMWAVDVGHMPQAVPRLPVGLARGDGRSYPACRAEARRLRATGAAGFTAPAAALLRGGAGGWRVEGGLKPGPSRDGRTIVLFGSQPHLVGWRAAGEGRPDRDLLERVRYPR